MQLDIHTVNLQVSDALQEFTQKRIERALRPFHRNVERVDVRIEYINGPRGTLDKQCSVTAEIPGRRTIVVKRRSPDAYGAVLAACGPLGQTVSRALGKRRHVERVSLRWPEKAAEAVELTDGGD